MNLKKNTIMSVATRLHVIFICIGKEFLTLLLILCATILFLQSTAQNLFTAL